MPAAVGNIKLCPKCGETKSTDQFGKDSKRVDGLKPWCKACRKVEGKIDRERHQDRRKAWYLVYYAEHKEEYADRSARWRRENPERFSAISKRWIGRNPEKRKAIQASYDQGRDKSQRALALRIARKKDPQRFKLYNRSNRLRNKEASKEWDRNKRAKRRLAEGSHTADDIRRILESQEWVCVYCGTSLRDSYHVDHIIPLAKGGSNWPDNLQCLCGPCNCRKGDKDPIEFERSLEQSLAS